MEDAPETIEQIRAEVEVSDAEPQNIPAEQLPQPTPIQQPIHETLPKVLEVHNDDDFEDDDDDDDDYDDDEEKDNSQKLVIDINDDEKDEDEDDDDDDVEELEIDNVPQELPPPQKQEEPQLKENEATSTTAKITDDAKPLATFRNDNADAIITLSDAEEETVTEAAIKPGKVQKRKSVGATATSNNEEERYRLKRRKINAEGAPKMPLTGYVRYMNDRRESVRKDHPCKNSIEVTKIIAEEWQALTSGVKAEYLKAAEVDKQRYLSELHTFLKSRPDILASELAKNKVRKNDNNAATTTAKPAPKEKPQVSDNAKSSKDPIKEKITPKEVQPAPSMSTQNSEKQQAVEKPKRKRTPTPPCTNAVPSTSTAAPTAVPSTSASASISAIATTSAAGSIVTPTSGEIPIFTNEFLEHNKIYDMELRSLRKSKTDLEQQNFVLEKHVENMKCGVAKMISENNELQEKNRLLEIYLDKLKRKLAQALGTLPLPSAPNGATVQNIDKYMQDLYKMSTSNSHGPATLNKAKDIIRKLDLQIQL